MPSNTPSRPSDADRVKELEAENARLKRELVDAGQSTPAKPHVPGFLPEGTREELERTGKAVNPFNGDRLVGDGKGEPRTVSADEFAKTPAKTPADK